MSFQLKFLIGCFILGLICFVYYFYSKKLKEEKQRVGISFSLLAAVICFVLMGLSWFFHLMSYKIKTPENGVHRVGYITLPEYKEDTLTIDLVDSIQNLDVRLGEIKDFDICCNVGPEKDCGCLETHTDLLSLEVQARVVSCPDRLMPLENVCSKPKNKKAEDVFQVEED